MFGRLIAKVQSQTTPISAGEESTNRQPVERETGEDNWDEYAPGIDPAAYNPKPLPPIPVNEPVSSLGRFIFAI